jgi:hypothetical protein
MNKYIAILLLAFSGAAFAECYEVTNFTGVHADSDYDYSLNSVDLWNIPTKKIVLDGLNSNVDGEDRDCNQVAEYMLMCMSQSSGQVIINTWAIDILKKKAVNTWIVSGRSTKEGSRIMVGDIVGLCD